MRKQSDAAPGRLAFRCCMPTCWLQNHVFYLYMKHHYVTFFILALLQ